MVRESASHESLRALAEKAHPGPWYSPGADSEPINPNIAHVFAVDGFLVTGSLLAKDALFIAAANPAVVVELLDEIEYLRGGETCQDCGRTYDEVYSVPDEVWALITPKPESPGAGLLCAPCALGRVVALLSEGAKT